MRGFSTANINTQGMFCTMPEASSQLLQQQQQQSSTLNSTPLQHHIPFNLPPYKLSRREKKGLREFREKYNSKEYCEFIARLKELYPQAVGTTINRIGKQLIDKLLCMEIGDSDDEGEGEGENESNGNHQKSSQMHHYDRDGFEEFVKEYISRDPIPQQTYTNNKNDIEASEEEEVDEEFEKLSKEIDQLYNKKSNRR
jgi:hypothetical protein